MTSQGGALRRLAIVTPFLLLGFFLRLWNWDSWPPGPWIDEAYAIRSARIVLGEPGHSVFGSYPLTPPDAGFVNSYSSNLYLYATGLVDRIAGGGIASFRVMSIGPALLLLIVSTLFAIEILGSSPWALGFATALLATSSWLLTTARWGWNAVSTSLLVVTSVWLLTRAQRRGSQTAEALAAGALLGLAQYGYVAAWLVLPLPLLSLALSWLRKDRERTKLFATAAAAAFVVAAPYAIHLLRSPQRATARAGELLIFRQPLAEQPRLLLSNAAAYGTLFISGGDRNERHGDPETPVLPPLVSLLAVAGGAFAVARPGPARLLLLAAALLVSGGLLSYQEGGANSYRISLAAPFIVLLAADGAKSVLEKLPARFARLAIVVLAVTGIAAAASGVLTFTGWASSERLQGAFGGPERALADTISAVRSREEAPVFLDPAAVRNHHVVDTLLRDPANPSPAVRLIDLGSSAPLGRTAGRRVLLVLSAEETRAPFAARLGARAIAQGGALPGFPGWILYELSR